MEKNLGHVTAYGYAKSKGYSGTEEEFAQLMADYASVGQSAAQSAEQAAASATSASGSAATASQAAQTATSKASEAVTAAGTATTKASEASQSATSASQSAESAGTSAQTATTAATTATTKASEASESAATATAAKTDAETARDAAAQSASEAAESAESIDPDEFDRKIYAAFATDTATGAIASFPDGADSIPMKDVLVHVEPVQDLHGYDSPWPAGGGKNKLPSIAKITATQNGITFVCDGDGSCSFSGTATAQALFSYTVPAVTLPENVYVHTFNSNEYDTNIRPILDFYYDNVRVDFVGFISANRIYNGTPAMAGKTINRLLLQVPAGFSGTCAFKLYISETADIENFSPYSNICPITGWTGAKVMRTGKNLCNKQFEHALYTADGTYYSHENGASKYISVGKIPVKEGMTYIFSWVDDASNIVYTSSVCFYNGADFVSTTMLHGAKYFTVPATANNAAIVLLSQDNITHIADIAIANPQLELGSTATDYEPYSGQTYDITFPSEAGTVYGGTLDVTTGELVVDRAIIASYAGEILPSTWISDRDVYSEGATPTTGAQVCYELATPITYQLTPQEITSLLGENNVWADTGNTEVEYRASTKMYIDKKITEAVSALS